jgi:nucleoside-diphosphate-sugar epimerase
MLGDGHVLDILRRRFGRRMSEIHAVLGTGALGLAVARQLVTGGVRVRLVSRSRRAGEPAGVDIVAADVSDPAAARRACDGAGVVFHCASGLYATWPQTLPPIMAGIIEGAAAAGARIVYGDNLYAYGPVSGPLTEDLPFRPIGANTRVRAEVATTLMNAHASGRVQATIGRASDFYGRHAILSTIGDRVFARALAGKSAQVLGNPDAPHTYTFIDDFARALVTLAQSDEALGQAWHVPSAETVTTRRFVEMVFEQLDAPARLQRTPALAIALLGLVNPTMRAVNEVLYQSQGPWRVDHSKYTLAFGSSPTTHQEAIGQTLAWFRQQPQELTAN